MNAIDVRLYFTLDPVPDAGDGRRSASLDSLRILAGPTILPDDLNKAANVQQHDDDKHHEIDRVERFGGR